MVQPSTLTATLPAPPDLRTENDMLRMRAHAAELALYQIEEGLRKFLEESVQPVVKRLHEINRAFPLGDDTSDGVQQIMIRGIRASVPGMADKTDAEIVTLFFGGKS